MSTTANHSSSTATTNEVKKNKIKLGNLTASKKFPATIIEGAINLDVLNEDKVKDLIYEYEGKKYLNIKVVTRKEPKNGKTHYIEIDTFVPNRNGKSEQ